MLGEFANLGGPWFEEPLADEWFGDVVQHKGLLGESRHQFQGSRQLLGVDEDVVGEPKLAEGSDALEHRGADEEALVRLVLCDMADYESRHAGSINTGRPLVLAEGMKVERISSTLDDTGLSDARAFSVQDVSRIYGVPVSMLSGESGSGYGTMEWLSRMYVDACLVHWLHAWQSEVLLKLASPFDSMTWDLDSIIRPGIAEQMAALRTGVEAGFLTRNEARAKLDLPPLPGLDEPTLALNVGTGGGQTNIGTDTSEQEGTPNDF